MTVPISIRKLFTDLEAVWKSHDFSKMRGFWAKRLEAPLYLPEERKDFITTWADFDAYFAGTAKASKGGLVTYQPLIAMPMSQGLQMVAFTLEWTMQLVTDAKPIGGSVRGVALVDEEMGDAKLKAYIEAPLAPILYMRDLYELVAQARGFKPIP
ncbi:MAG: hypothetical protein SFV19_03550 [Rhodospirillaceae bacterium]|nr:hypothetical protein [Rhodospirillaceae bacterium]